MEYRHTNTTSECTKAMEEEIRKVCQQLIYQNRKLGSIDASQFPSISYNSIQKIYRTTYHSMESKQETIIKENMQNLISEFECGVDLNRMAEKYCYMYPVLVRLFLQAYYKLDPAVVLSYIHHPISIPHPRLRSSAEEYIFGGYGDILRNDAARMSSGYEYEYLVKEHLRNLNIPFMSESTARLEGLSKTPDVVFPFPVSVKTNSYLSNPTHSNL